MPLFEKIPDMLESDSNFAYFCKFDREDSTSGIENLYSGGDMFSCTDSIDGETAGILNSAFRNGPAIPVIVPYDFVTEVFPDSNIRRSQWPLLLGFIPDNFERNVFRRKGKESRSTSVSGEADPQYSSIVKTLKGRIISGEILQGVLSRRFELPSLNIYERITRYLQGDRSLYVFLFRIGDFTVLGSSPENIISVYGDTAEIFPIAGTVPRGENDLMDQELGIQLLNSEKDKLEHRMLVDLARNDLGKISENGTVKVDLSMALRKYASVQHLVSHVVSTLVPDNDPISILKAVFPAGTVSGAPKRRACELIDRLESFPRGGYAGAAGIISHKEMDLALCLRSIFGLSGKYYTQAGAGIVKDSDPEMESREVTSKVLTATGGLKDEYIDC